MLQFQLSQAKRQGLPAHGDISKAVALGHSAFYDRAEKAKSALVALDMALISCESLSNAVHGPDGKDRRESLERFLKLPVQTQKRLRREYSAAVKKLEAAHKNLENLCKDRGAQLGLAQSAVPSSIALASEIIRSGTAHVSVSSSFSGLFEVEIYISSPKGALRLDIGLDGKGKPVCTGSVLKN